MKNDFDFLIPYHFTARDYQIPFLSEVERALSGKSEKRFFYQVWHRRSGKDKTNIADVIPRRLIQSPALVKYVYPTLVMGRDNLWNGIGKDGFKYINHIPEQIRLAQANETRMSIEVKTIDNQQSLFQVAGTNRPDSLRGGNPMMFVFSEWADHDPYAWDVIEPILRENNGIAIFNTTPKGDNHARALFEFAKGHPAWYVETLTVDQTSVFTKQQMEGIIADVTRRFEANGRSRDEAEAYINQEYYCSFDSPVLGSYYGANITLAEKEGRITRVPYDQTLPVYTAWDLGMDDSTTIWFFQVVNQEFRFIDYYESSGEGLQHYALKLQEKKYLYKDHFAPHDIAVRELGTGKSRLEVARSMGLNFRVGRNLGIEDGINTARSVFSRCWFDKEKCNRGIMALKNYKKEWDEKNMVYRNNPLHDWSSHGADAFRTFATGFQKPIEQQKEFGGVAPYIEGIG